MPESRYSVQEKLPEIGIQGQKHFSNAKVTIVGCGGLGCFVAQSLVGLGIGQLQFIDDDTIELQNLQRQLLFTESSVGFYKCEVVKEVLAKRNSEITLLSVKERLTRTNSTALLSGSDIVIDCSDTIHSRLIIDDFCASHGIAMIYGGIKGFEGQISVFNYRGGNSFRHTFPALQELFQEENCSDSGVVAQVASVVANLQVNEVMKILLHLPNLLQGQLQTINLLTNSFRVFKLSF